MTLAAGALTMSLRQRGVRIRTSDGRLIVEGPSTVLTQPLLEELQRRKAELLDVLADECRRCHVPLYQAGSLRLGLCWTCRRNDEALAVHAYRQAVRGVVAYDQRLGIASLNLMDEVWGTSWPNLWHHNLADISARDLRHEQAMLVEVAMDLAELRVRGGSLPEDVLLRLADHDYLLETPNLLPSSLEATVTTLERTLVNRWPVIERIAMDLLALGRLSAREVWARVAPEREAQLSQIAHHEAGHAVACYVLGRGPRLVSIVEGYGSIGYCLRDPLGEGDEDPLVSSVISLAGPVAQGQFAGCHDEDGAAGDLRSVEQVMDELELEGAGREQFVARTRAQAEALVTRYWTQVKLLADALHDQLWLTGADVRTIIEGGIDYDASNMDRSHDRLVTGSPL